MKKLILLPLLLINLCACQRGEKGEKGDTVVIDNTVQVYRYTRTPDKNPYEISVPELAMEGAQTEVNGLSEQAEGSGFPTIIKLPVSGSVNHWVAITPQNTVQVMTQFSDGTIPATALKSPTGKQWKLQIIVRVYQHTNTVDKTQQLLYGMSIKESDR